MERAPVDATVQPAGDGVQIVAAKEGLAVDVPATAAALLTAVTSADNRTAELVVRTAPADRTTADVQAMGIERRLASYTTLYAGTSDRITNLQLAISLLNGALVAPGATFSLNERVGERTLERGFRPAPVIIKDEYDEAVGGGVSQVATTVFNAAWEAGLKIAERAPHSLYISRYQTGRDATVNYPDLDLKFVNDTPNWILVAGASGDSGITVSLYGGGPERRVESGEASLRVTGPAPIRRVKDPELLKGTTTVEEEGSPARATSVTRTVYGEDGEVLHDETWNTSYRGEYRIIRVGTKPKPKPKKPPPDTKNETPPAEPTPGAETPTVRRLGRSNPFGEPHGDSRRPAGGRVDGRVRRRSFRHELVAPLDRVLVAEARAADVDTACPDPEAVVEVGGAVVADIDGGRQRLDPLRLDRQVAAGVLGEVRDARDLEPDDERGVVRDPLRIRLGEADEDVGREVVTLDALHLTIRR